MQAGSKVAVASDAHPRNVAQGGEQSESAQGSPNHAATAQSQPPNPVTALPVHGRASSRSSGRTTQPPTAVVSTMLEVTDDMLYGEENLDPILPRDQKVAKVLDYRRCRLSAQKMSHAATTRVDRIKLNFPLTTNCTDGRPFNGNGPEPELPLAEYVITSMMW